jgi:hypothetical protein
MGPDNSTGFVFGYDQWARPQYSTTAGYNGYVALNPLTMNITYSGDGVDGLKDFISGITEEEQEKLTPSEHPLVAIGDDVELINLANGTQIEGRLEDILTGKDVEYVYVVNGTRYYEPEWTIFE